MAWPMAVERRWAMEKGRARFGEEKSMATVRPAPWPRVPYSRPRAAISSRVWPMKAGR